MIEAEPSRVDVAGEIQFDIEHVVVMTQKVVCTVA